MDDVATTLREAHRWLMRGCEIGMYPYVIPFSGAAFAQDPKLVPHTVMADRRVSGTGVQWQQAAKILPVDPVVRDAILRIEATFEDALFALQSEVAHLPSRVRSLLWIQASLPVMAEHGFNIADEREVRAELHARLPAVEGAAAPSAVALA
jgi:hypothetical protein